MHTYTRKHTKHQEKFFATCKIAIKIINFRKFFTKILTFWIFQEHNGPIPFIQNLA